MGTVDSCDRDLFEWKLKMETVDSCDRKPLRFNED